MKSIINTLVVCVGSVLMASGLLNAQQTSVQPITISTTGQGLFGPGAATVIQDTVRMIEDSGGDAAFYVPFSVNPVCLPQAVVNPINDAIGFINTFLPPNSQLDPIATACFGADVDIKFGFDFDAYFRTLISSGDVDISYPFQATFIYPNPNTFSCNEYGVIQTSMQTQSGYAMSLQEPVMEFAVGATLRPGLYVGGSLCAFDCTPIANPVQVPLGFSTATPANYKSKLGGGDFDLVGFSTTGGILFPWNYYSFIPKPSGFPNLTLPLNTYIIPGDPVYTYAKVKGLLDNPFGGLDSAPEMISGDTISSLYEKAYLNLSFDPIQFQEYLTGVPLTLSKSLGGGAYLNATVISLPFLFDATQIHDMKFYLDDVSVTLTLSKNAYWKEVTPGGDTIKQNYGTTITGFTLGNKLLVKSQQPVTVTPSYSITSNTFINHIFQELQFSWSYKILELSLTFPAVSTGSVCNEIVDDLNIPYFVITNPFDPTQSITLEQIVLDACEAVVNVANNGLLMVGPLVADTIAIGPPITIPIIDTTFSLGGFNTPVGASFLLDPDTNPPLVTFKTSFVKSQSALLVLTKDSIITSISGGGFAYINPTPLLFQSCGDLVGDRPVTVTIVNNCTSRDTVLHIHVAENTPPSCSGVRTDTLQIAPNQVLKASDFWIGGLQSCDFVSGLSSVSPSLFTCANEGVQTVSLTLSDASGNTAMCTAKVNVVGAVQTLYVNAGATGSNNGSSWSNAFTDLQSALSAACTGSVIYVAEGTYYPTSGTNQQINYTLNKALSLYGGFSPANGVTLPGQRNWNLYPTILSGDIDHDGLLDPDNSQTVIYTTATATVDGFIIEFGYADGTVIPHSRGGGVFIDSESTFENCTFRNNWGIIGGAAYNFSGASTFRNCLFYDNIAMTNSSVLSPAQGSPSLYNCTMVDNVSPLSAMDMFQAALTIRNCIFWNNGGDLSCTSTGSITVSNSLIQDASLPSCGINGGGNTFNQNPLFEDAPNNNFRLTASSPALNTGSNTYATSVLDLDRRKRIFQNIVDKGCYEYQCPTTVQPTSHTVTISANDGIGSLRNLVEQFACPGDTIYFSASLNGVPITIDPYEIQLTKDLVFIGNGAGNTIVQGSTKRLFRVYNIASVEFHGMTLRGGYTNSHGGAIYSDGNVLLSYCVLQDNEATGQVFGLNFGGAVYSLGGLTINHCLISGNKSSYAGGVNIASGTAEIRSSTIAGNYATTYSGAGGVRISGGSLMMYNTVVSGNKDFYSDNILGSYSGAGNRIGGVLFVAPADPTTAPNTNGNYQLTVAESGINKGKNAYVSETVDLAGGPRILEGVVDPGAYEKAGCGTTHYNLYVDKSHPAGGNGLSWATAYTELHSALIQLNSVDCTIRIDTIFVAEGQYNHPSQFSVNYLLVNRPTILMGGYPAGGGMRDYIAHETRLNGRFAPAPLAAQYTVIDIRDDIVMDGFIIENGNARGTIFPANPNLYFYYLGGGVINRGNSTYRNCIFRNNNALYGGAFYSYEGNPVIENCIFFGNSASHNESTDDRGSAIFILDGNATIRNVTIADNTCDHGNAIVHCEGGSAEIVNTILWDAPTPVSARNNADVEVHHSLVQSGLFVGTVTSGVGNIFGQYPQFIDPHVEDYRLRPCSPGVNTGDNSAAVGSTDFDGNGRIFGGTADMGAFEFQASPLPVQGTVYVDASVPVSGNGNSWGTALKTLAEAYDASQFCGVDTIFIAEGTYYPTNGVAPDAALISYLPLVVLGGYPAQGAGPRNWNTHPTIISGDINNSGTADSGDSYSIFINQDDLELNGLIIEGGFADGADTYGMHGGGVYNSGRLYIYNSILRDNHAHTSSGGGIYHAGPYLEMISTLMYDNTSDIQGAAISMTGTGTFSLVNCTIVDNVAMSDNLGVIYAISTQTGAVRNSILWNPGEGEVNNISAITLANVIVEGGKPSSVVNGGGINVNNPVFVSPETRDYTLRECSPAIDAGLNILDFDKFGTDLNNHDRVTNVSMDMGAYEFQDAPDYNYPLIRLYVDASAAPNGDGLSWATAYQNLTDALARKNTIIACIDVDTIFVAEGLYKPSSSGTRTEALQLISGKNVVIMGGYPSGGGERDWTTHVTVLSGDLDNSGTANLNDSYTVLYNQGTLVLDGMIVRHGYANGVLNGSSLQHSGSGIYNSGNLTLNHCIVRNNHANLAGAGMHMSGGNVKIYNTVFYSNTAGAQGGAINASGTYNLTMTNSTLFGNSATNTSADGIFIQSTGVPVFANTIFWNDAGDEFNFISSGQANKPTFRNCVVQGGLPANTIDLGGNISSDPLFVNEGTADFALQSCSPAINAGNTAQAVSLGALDLGHFPRVTEDTVDIGAFENGDLAYVLSSASPIICEGDSVLLQGVWQYASGVYVDTLASDCNVSIDTIRTSTLNVLNVSRHTVMADVCLLSEAGTVIDTIQGGSANGCDSIVTHINHYVAPSPEFVYVLVCDIENTYTDRDTLFGGSMAGCDSIIVTVYYVRKLYPPQAVEITCGDSVLVGGQYYGEPGTYNDTLMTAMGCDSIVPTTITVNPVTHFYVDMNAEGTDNGTSWTNAFINLQDALQSPCLKPGDSVFVAVGLYVPDAGGTAVIDDRNSEFLIPAGVTVLGGYPIGGGPRNIVANPTYLSGDIDFNDAWFLPQSPAQIVGQNAYTVVHMAGGTLDGVTITAGLADETQAFPGRRQRGAGIFNEGNSVIRNCVVTGNYAPGGTDDGMGAGVFHLNGNARYENCLVTRNFAGGSGGGFNCAHENPELINCTISLNEDGSLTGGIAGTSANVSMKNSIIWGNDNQVAIIGTGSLSFSNSIFEGTLPEGGSYTDNGFNLVDDPLFVNPAGGDFHVDNCLSPANDGGDNTAVESTTDLDMDVRIQGSAVDIGAYENGPNLPLLVTNTANDGLGSLRAVLASACANGIVQFDPGLATETITLTGPQIIIDKNVKIYGLGLDNLSISGEGNGRVFTIDAGKYVRIADLNLINGDPVEGVILNQGHLTLKDVRME